MTDNSSSNKSSQRFYKRVKTEYFEPYSQGDTPWEQLHLNTNDVNTKGFASALSSLYAVNSQLSEMPVIAVNSREHVTWANLSKDIITPFSPKTKLLTKHVAFKLGEENQSE